MPCFERLVNKRQFPSGLQQDQRILSEEVEIWNFILCTRSDYHAREGSSAATYVFARVGAPCDAGLVTVALAALVGDLDKSQWRTDYESE